MKRIREKRDRKSKENTVDPHFIRNLATHGLTGEELKRIVEEIRMMRWKKGEDDSRKDLS
jgi:hypothetical protein